MSTDGIGSTSFLSDNETKIDLISNEAIATTIITLLLKHPDRPVTIGVHGDWGAGKSSVLEMIDDKLNKQDGILCLKFNGWRFQGFEDAKIALLEGIVTGLLEKRPMLSKAVHKVKEVFHRIDWLKVAKHTGSLAFTAFTGIPTLAQIQTVVSTLETMFQDPTKRPPKEDIDKAFESAYSLIKPNDPSKNVPEEIGEFRKAFDDLLEEAKVNRLIVLIDDLDRCLPDTAIETLEAVRLFVFTPRTAFVIAADEAMIEYAVRKHFPDLPNTSGPQTYARNYLEKLIQVPFRIPPLGITETRIYVTLLLVGAELGENDPDFGKLLDAARERLKRPWAGEAIDSTLIRTNLGEKVNKVNHSLILSDQIGPILANGTSGNPRQIKRFLNALMLRKQTADARGFGDDIKLPVLAKLMLAERFNPPLFEQIAGEAISSSKGICEKLRQLEAQTKPGEQTVEGEIERSNQIALKDSEKKTSKTKGESVKNMQFDEWISFPWILEWATIQPSLTDIDLRPYLFVTKDRKDYFGTMTVLGHLASIAEKLFGPKLSIQAQENDLKQLSTTEANQVFEMVRSRIIGSDAFDSQPGGVDGLTILAKAHPTLQSNLLDFLENLPIDHTGAWVVRGWMDVIKDGNAVERYHKLLQKWSTSTNLFLKTAADGALETLKRGQ